MPVIEIERTFSPEDPQTALARMMNRDHIRSELASTIDSAARVGEQSLRIYAPKGKTLSLERHIDRTRAHDGLEGDVVAETGVKRIEGRGDPRRGRYPDKGTGIYGPKGAIIRPTSSRFMVFLIDGRKFVRSTVRGQRPQHFVRDAYHDVEAYLPGRLEVTARRIVEG